MNPCLSDSLCPADHPKSPREGTDTAKHLPLRLERGLEPLGNRRKEFGEAEGLQAERAGASESLGRGEVSILHSAFYLLPSIGQGEVSIPDPCFSLLPFAKPSTAN